jgi:uncharacterized protein (TIGR02266 family)
MASRDYERAPGRLQVEFRSPTALLVAYTVNLSRGGMFIQCGTDLPPEGAVLDLDITLPDRSVVELQGVVTWQRPDPNENGPRGVGVQFDTLAEELGEIVDSLVVGYSSISILVLSKDARDRKTLLRMIKSVIGTAEVDFVDDFEGATSSITKSTDLVIVDADEARTAAANTVQLATSQHAIPTIALAKEAENKEALKSAGAKEILSNPPSAAALRRAMLQLLSTPTRVVTPVPQ